MNGDKVASPAFESADIKTVREALEQLRHSYPGCLYQDEAIKSLTRLSARQAAFIAMHEWLLKLVKITKKPEGEPTMGLIFLRVSEDFLSEAEVAFNLAEAELRGKS